MPEPRRALISVSDKTGIVEFARKLVAFGYEIVSTGGTASLLKENHIPVIPIDEVTGFPEMMDGRVKTLHPNIHGAILGLRDRKDHAARAKEMGIKWIDMVVVNLYPFEKTLKKEGVTIEEAIENIDIGGPTLLRSAAKNHPFVTVITDPEDYDRVLEELGKGEISLKTRQALAVKVFNRTADYDGAIDRHLSGIFLGESVLRLKYGNGQQLRYGENSHQTAAFYKDKNCRETAVSSAEILQGKAMSYNNYIDADAALEAVKDLKGQIGVAVIKHTNPCGYATGETAVEALERAWYGDPISAFGAVIACNSKVDLDFARFLKGKDVDHFGYTIINNRLVPQKAPNKFVEVLIAPDYDEDALELFSESKTLRVLRLIRPDKEETEKKTYRKITGGMLEMDRDLALWEKFESVTKIVFPEAMKGLAEFTYKACKHTKSNAIVLGRAYRPGYYQVVGMGAGQPNRVDSLRKLSVTKAQENLQIEYDLIKPGIPLEDYIRKAFGEMVLASDAFFPFDDTVRTAAEFGIRYIVQPGGSLRDADSVNACNELGISMALMGLRHFRH